MYNPKVQAFEQTEDINYSLYSYYEGVVNQAISYLGKYYINFPNSNIFYNMKNNLNNDFCYYIFYGSVDGSDYLGAIPTNKNMINIIQYATTTNKNKIPTSYDYLGLYSITVYNFTGSDRYWTLSTPNIEATTGLINSFYMPLELYNYKTTNWIQFENAIRGNDISAILDLLEQINDDIGEIKDYIQEAPSSSDFYSSDLPSDSGVTATTDEGLNNYFTRLYTTFTAQPNSLYDITINIPFTNKSFVIPYNLTSNVINKSSFSWLKTFINAFWYYIVGRYIILDLIRKFEKIQTGNIENIENENIKEDLL